MCVYGCVVVCVRACLCACVCPRAAFDLRFLINKRMPEMKSTAFFESYALSSIWRRPYLGGDEECDVSSSSVPQIKTDKQIDGQTDGQADRKTNRQTIFRRDWHKRETRHVCFSVSMTWDLQGHPTNSSTLPPPPPPPSPPPLLFLVPICCPLLQQPPC